MELVEVQQTRAKIITDMRANLAKAEAENRSLNTEEKDLDERLWKTLGDLDDRIMRLQRSMEAERQLATQQAQRQDPTRGEPREQTGMIEYRKHRVRRNQYGQQSYAEAFATWLGRNRDGLTAEGRAISHEELRALSMGTDSAGGYTVVPQQFMTELLKFVDDMLFIRMYARILPPLDRAASLGVVSLDTDVSDADWTAELLTGNEDSAVAFGRRELRPHPLAKRIKVSDTLMRTSAWNIEDFVRMRLGYKFGVTQEKAYLTGNGTQKPLGVFVASNEGISTSRDISTGNTATAIGADGLINAKFSIKQQYWPRLRWLFHRDGVKQIRQLKDGNGQYLWQPGITGGIPDRIIESPYDMSEYAPNTFTTGLYAGIIADWSFYWIVDALDMRIQRLVELYAETNQIGFIARYEGDGMPVLEEAFARVKLL